MRNSLIIALFLLLLPGYTSAQTYLLEKAFKDRIVKDEITRAYITPSQIVWQSDTQNNQVKNTEILLTEFDGQLTTSGRDMCVLRSDDEAQASVLLDFGRELYGGIEIAAAIRKEKNPVRVRVRLGESVTEAMSDAIDNNVPGIGSATNDHAMRDFTLEIPWLGTIEIGNSGFRYARIDLLDQKIELPIRSVRAILRYRDIPYLGSFKSDNERLNEIWNAGAYTVHLNMQEYLWDGIKRDRLVWLGDVHPEVMSINAVFGDTEVVRKSLDFGRDTTPLPGWMNGMSSYSLWWIISHRDFYLTHGDLDYLKEQRSYLSGLVDQLISRIDSYGGGEKLDGRRFLDWPTSEDPDVIHSGLQSLMVMTFEAGKDIAEWINDKQLKEKCEKALLSLNKHVPSMHHNKQAAALLSLANMVPANEAVNVILKDGAKDFATFYGYYMLEALAKNGRYQEAMEIISDYWGAMLDLGATTFWENFNYLERVNAVGIDELPDTTRFNIHADGGDHCYIGLRASLCHGWASGPTAWLSRHVLGINVVEPGVKAVRICPNLGNLSYVEGTFPTPYGVIHVKHSKQTDGTIKSDIKVPEEVTVLP